MLKPDYKERMEIEAEARRKSMEKTGHANDLTQHGEPFTGSCEVCLDENVLVCWFTLWGQKHLLCEECEGNHRNLE